MSSLSETLFRQFTEGDDIRDAGQKTPANVRRVNDIVYGHDPKWQILDLYVPRRKKAGSLPVIISVHGGGWFYGDKERYQYYCMSLVQHGFAVVNFTYRLAPEFKFPSPLEDTNLVVKWVLKNGRAYGLDTKHIFMVGDSAGGQLVGSYANICTNEAYARQFTFHVPAHFRPTAVALNCGVYSVERLFEGNTNVLMTEDYLPRHGTKKEKGLIDVVGHVTSAFPPAFVLSAAQDYLRPEALNMAAVLIEKKVPVELRVYADPAQPLNHVFHCDMRLPQAAAANRHECEFFKEFL